MPRLRQLNGIATLVGYPPEFDEPQFRGLSIGTVQSAQVLDGASHTIALGEKIDFTRPGGAVPDESLRRWNWWVSSNLGDSLFTEYMPINYYLSRRIHRRIPAQAPAAILGASSRHPGGANFGFCDGSVRFLKASIDCWTIEPSGLPVGVVKENEAFRVGPSAHIGVYQALGSRNGREAISDASF